MAVARDGAAVRRRPGAGHHAGRGLAAPARALGPDRRARPPHAPRAAAPAHRARGRRRARRRPGRDLRARGRRARAAARPAIVAAVVAYLVGRRRRDRGARHPLRAGAPPARPATATAADAPRAGGRLAGAGCCSCRSRPGSPRSPFFCGYYDSGSGCRSGSACSGSPPRALIARPPRLDARRRCCCSPGSPASALWALVSALLGRLDRAGGRRGQPLLVVRGARARAARARAERARRRCALLGAFAVGALVRRGVVVVVRMLGSRPGRRCSSAAASTSRWATSTGRRRFFLLGAWPLPRGRRAARRPARSGRRRWRARRCSAGSRCCRSRAASRSAALASVVVVLAVVPGRARRGWALRRARRRDRARRAGAARRLRAGATAPLPARSATARHGTCSLAAAGAALLWGLATLDRGSRAAAPSGCAALAGGVAGRGRDRRRGRRRWHRPGAIADDGRPAVHGVRAASVEPQGSGVSAAPSRARVRRRQPLRLLARSPGRRGGTRRCAASARATTTGPYFAQRATDRGHPPAALASSCRLLSELGLVGALLLGSLLGRRSAAARRDWRARRAARPARGRAGRGARHGRRVAGAHERGLDPPAPGRHRRRARRRGLPRPPPRTRAWRRAHAPGRGDAGCWRAASRSPSR